MHEEIFLNKTYRRRQVLMAYLLSLLTVSRLNT